MSDPTGFLRYSRRDPGYRPVGERLRDWNEIYADTDTAEKKRQGLRCMDCGVPFCQGPTGCPVDNLIPEWNALITSDRWREALDRLHLTNNFPEFTSKLCPAPCESACVLGINDDPVAIKSIEGSIIDRGFAEGWITPRPAAYSTHRRVAVVGSGPAGLTCAQQLARAGHAVTVLEKNEEVGGLLRFGIPDFKLEKWRIERRLDQLRAEGVRFMTGVEVGRDLSIDELRRDYDAVALTVGAERAFELDVPGRDLQGVHLAMDYLVAQNRQTKIMDAKDRDVVIIGGGDTGSDCLGTAHRQGARSVTQFELLNRPPTERSEATPWPHWPMKLRTSHAHLEGGQREWSIRTLEFIGSAGKVVGLKTDRVEKTNTGFAAIAGTEATFKADLVILAVGFRGTKSLGSIQTTARGTIQVDANFATPTPGVFAAGDATRGASLIVWAIADGRRMAASIDNWLRAQSTNQSPRRVD